MKIIGLTGAAGSGKDTACGFALAWCEAHGLNAERAAFADPLKVSAARALGFQGASELYSPEEVAECVAFCNEIKQPDVTVRVEKYIPPYCGSEPVPPEYIPITEISGRQFLQFYGTEAHRDVFGQSFWTDVTAKYLDEREAEGVDVAFIADTRFPNEGQFVADLGEVWSVERPLETKVEAHSSEIPLPDALIARLINNTGSLDDLRDQVRLVCEERLEI